MRNLRPGILTLAVTHFNEVCQSLKGQGAYSNPRKTQFRDELVRISDTLSKCDFYQMSPDAIKALKTYVTVLFMPWAMALDTRNAYTLSHEMRRMMDNLCRQWVPDPDKFVFTSADGNFSCVRYDSDWDLLMDNIERIYGVKPSYQLIMFNIPKHLNEDFLFVGSLYHEMGHFVDAYYNIWDRVYQKIIARFGSPADALKIRGEYFPIIGQTYEGDTCKDGSRRNKFLVAQIKEYIADLFATQYLGCHRGNHIEYVAAGLYDRPDDEHPSPECRWAMEEAFMKDDRSNFVYADIADEFAATGHPLTIRTVKPADSDALDKGEPLAIYNDDELHSLLWYGWEVYLKGPQTMAVAQGTPGVVLSQYDFYKRLNTAIKQSISNYLK